MKPLIVASLLILGAAAPVLAESGTADSQRAADDAKSLAQRDAEDAKLRVQLDKARSELDRKAQEVAELSMKLSGSHDFVYRTGGPRQAMLGVQIDPQSDKQGARVRSVSPGGPADEAGLRDGDVIVALDGKSIAGNEDAGRVLVERMRDVKPDQKVKVRVLRDGKNRDLVVAARPMRPMITADRVFVRGPGMDVASVGMAGPGPGPGAIPMIRQFRFHNEFNGLELARITPKLGAYFGVNDGVLVVSAPKDDALKLEDGDVIQTIDGRKPEDGAHALRILRSYKSGEKLNLAVLRQRKPVTLAVTMPERGGDFEEGIFSTTMMPPPPEAPAVPPPPPGHAD